MAQSQVDPQKACLPKNTQSSQWHTLQEGNYDSQFWQHFLHELLDDIIPDVSHPATLKLLRWCKTSKICRHHVIQFLPEIKSTRYSKLVVSSKLQTVFLGQLPGHSVCSALSAEWSVAAACAWTLAPGVCMYVYCSCWVHIGIGVILGYRPATLNLQDLRTSRP